MTLYSGMNNTSGKVITDIDHLRQSVRDILLTPQGSRIARREYGSLLSALIDQPQNPALRLQVMSAVYVALSRWEPRLTLDSITIKRSRAITWWVRMKTCWYLIALMPTGATLNGQRKCSGNACNAALRHSRYNWRKGGQIFTRKCQ